MSNAILDGLDLDATFLAEERRALRAMVRRFVAAEIVPAAPEWETARRIPADAWRKLGDAGLLGLSFPEALGGGGAGMRGTVVFNEELGRSTSARIDAGAPGRAYAATLKAEVPGLVNDLVYSCVQFLGGAGFVRPGRAHRPRRPVPGHRRRQHRGDDRRGRPSHVTAESRYI